MTGRGSGRRVALIVLTCWAGTALGWAPETRVRMVDEALRFMPRSLRTALESHQKELRRGMLAPMVDEDGPEHRPPWAGGTLDARLAEDAQALVDALGRQTPFDEIALRFGTLAHRVADAGFPPGVGDGDGPPRYRHFAAFCEERRGKFPLVFYGHGDPALDRGDYAAFARAVMARARAEDATLARAYAAAGNPPSPAAFDDRSIPFAVGSLGYSRSINDIVRVWLAVWREAGGDLGRTPYLRRPESP